MWCAYTWIFTQININGFCLVLDIKQENSSSSSTTYKDDTKKDGQGDQNVLSGSEKERKCNSEEEDNKDGHMNLPPNPNIVYMKTTKDKEKGVKITTSVSVSDMKDSVPKITFQLSHELLSEHLSGCSTSLSEMTKTRGFGLELKLEMKDRMEPNRRAVESNFHFTYGDECKEAPPTAEWLERPSGQAWTSREAPSGGQTQEDARQKRKDSPDVCRYFGEQGFSSGGHGAAPSTEEPRPHLRSMALDGLALSALHHTHFHPASTDQAGKGFPAAALLSGCERRRCSLQRPPENISCPERKSWLQNVGAEQHGCAFPMKRCHTFPGMSEALGLMQEELLLPYQGCVWSLILNSLPLNMVRLGNIHQEKIHHSSLGSRRPQRPASTWTSDAEVPMYQQDMMICGLNPHRRQTISRYRCGNVKLHQEGRQGNFDEEADGWFYQELEGEDPRPEQPPEEPRPTQMPHQPVKPGEQEDGASVLPQPVAGEHPGTLPPAAPALWSEDTNHLLRNSEARGGEQKQEAEGSSSPSAATCADKPQEKPTKMEESSQQSASRRKSLCRSAGLGAKPLPDSRWKPPPVSTDTSQRLRPVDTSVSDHWAAKRKLFKESKQWSSAGGSSITSDMTDEQGLLPSSAGAPHHARAQTCPPCLPV